MNAIHRYALELLLAFTIAFLTIFALRATGACASERTWEHTACENLPGVGRWGYRILDDKRCWFRLDADEPRGKYRSKWRLYWPDEDIKPMTVRPASEFEHRWKGESETQR